MQSLVPSLSFNKLLPYTIFFSSIYLSLNKNSTLPDWQKQDPSGLTKLVPLRIGKIKTPPDWQKQDPSGLAKTGPLRIGKIKTPPDWQNWDPSGLGPLRFYKNNSLETFKTFTRCPSGYVLRCYYIVLLNMKGVFSFPIPFRIEAKPLI